MSIDAGGAAPEAIELTGLRGSASLRWPAAPLSRLSADAELVVKVQRHQFDGVVGNGGGIAPIGP